MAHNFSSIGQNNNEDEHDLSSGLPVTVLHLEMNNDLINSEDQMINIGEVVEEGVVGLLPTFPSEVKKRKRAHDPSISKRRKNELSLSEGVMESGNHRLSGMEHMDDDVVQNALNIVGNIDPEVMGNALSIEEQKLRQENLSHSEDDNLIPPPVPMQHGDYDNDEEEEDDDGDLSPKGSNKRSIRGTGDGWQKREQLRKGRFTAKEDELLRMAVDEYCLRKGYDAGEGRRRLLSGKYDLDFRHAWAEIGSKLPERTIESLYYRARRTLAPVKTGTWGDEEVKLLVKLVHDIGPKWSRIGEQLGRIGTSARDKYRELSSNKSGKWSKEETDKLRELVEEHRQGDHIPWTTISKLMKDRNHNQCRRKWTNDITPSMNKWSADDDRTLINRIQLVNAMSDSDVNWSDIAKDLRWTNAQCSMRWKQLCKYVPPTGPDGLPLQFEERIDLIRKAIDEAVERQKEEEEEESLSPKKQKKTLKRTLKDINKDINDSPSALDSDDLNYSML